MTTVLQNAIILHFFIVLKTAISISTREIVVTARRFELSQRLVRRV